MSPPASPKSPLVAALITLAFPGFGHFYAGAWVRGVLVWVGLYIGFMLLAMTGRPVVLLLLPVLYGLAAWDAWRRAEAANAAAAVEAAAGVTPSLPLLGLWAACRFVWIAVIFFFGVISFAGVVSIIRHGQVLLAIPASLPGAATVVLAYLAGRETWKVLRRERALSPASLRDEVGATVLVAGICALCLAIVWPSFSNLLRYSSEGAMKGNLSGLRQAVAAYKDAHGGAAPQSLETVLDPKILPKIPPLWSGYYKTPHPKTTATFIVSERVGTDSGQWGYVVSPSSPTMNGTVFIDCTHFDARGSIWTSY